MSLHALPNEIIAQIAQFLPSERDLYYFGKVCRRLYRPVNLVLYRRNQVSGKALYWGAVKNIPTIIQHAVDAGTCVTDTDWPLLSYAASLGHVRALEALLKHGEIASFVWEVNESTPLLDGIRGNHTEVVKLLLDHGADPLEPLESRFRHSETPLHYATKWPNTNPDIVAMLIKAANGIAPHHPQHGTLLHIAAYHGHTKMAEILLDGGQDHMLLDPGKSTPLGLSAMCGHIETAKLLLAIVLCSALSSNGSVT